MRAKRLGRCNMPVTQRAALSDGSSATSVVLTWNPVTEADSGKSIPEIRRELRWQSSRYIQPDCGRGLFRAAAKQGAEPDSIQSHDWRITPVRTPPVVAGESCGVRRRPKGQDSGCWVACCTGGGRFPFPTGADGNVRTASGASITPHPRPSLRW